MISGLIPPPLNEFGQSVVNSAAAVKPRPVFSRRDPLRFAKFDGCTTFLNMTSGHANPMWNEIPPAPFFKGGETPGSFYSPFSKGGWGGIWEATCVEAGCGARRHPVGNEGPYVSF